MHSIEVCPEESARGGIHTISSHLVASASHMENQAHQSDVNVLMIAVAVSQSTSLWQAACA